MTPFESLDRYLGMLEGPLARLNESWEDDGHLFPLTDQPLDRNKRRALDAFLQRFQQVFDIMARKVFPAALNVGVGSPVKPYFRDILDGLERLELLRSADKSEDLNKLRNLLVHEYAMDDKSRAERLNQAFDAVPVLFETADRIRHISVAATFNDATDEKQP